MDRNIGGLSWSYIWSLRTYLFIWRTCLKPPPLLAYLILVTEKGLDISPSITIKLSRSQPRKSVIRYLFSVTQVHEMTFIADAWHAEPIPLYLFCAFASSPEVFYFWGFELEAVFVTEQSPRS